MKQRIFSCLLVSLIFFCSCSKSEDDAKPEEYTPQYVSYYGTPVFEVPYTNFGVTKEQVKQSLKNRALKEETADKLVYEGVDDTAFQAYYFESDKLIEATTYIKNIQKGAMIKDALGLTYKYWGDATGPISPFYVYANQSFYVGLTKQTNDTWMVVYAPHDRVTYKENTGNGVITIIFPYPL